MIHKKINNIVMLGAGNVATHMAAALHHKGFCIKQVFSRTSLSANELAKKVDADFCTDLNAVVKDADLYIISLSDDASENILQHFDAGNAILVHTSGTLP
ncbi:MAG: NAD(P)-binding domain-containing protein, partial [Bacteroidales bacterium]|nr:NAD(P)-binding domain-containing protein [Bacteroidales bacterium]